MTVTVIVCTRNRPEIIETCILSILNNTYYDFEFLIVDQSTDKKTEEIVKKHMNVDKRVRYIHMNTKGKTKALNLGIKNSSGDIIAQTDDDCLVSEDWLEKIVEAFNANPDVAIVFGSVVDTRALFGDKKERDLIKDGKFSGRLSKLLFIGDAANRAVKRIVYQKVKGHDELLGTGNPLLGTEDHDFAYRALKAGFRVLCVRKIIVDHYSYRIKDLKSYLSVIQWFSIGNGATWFKYIRCLDCVAFFIFFLNWGSRVKTLTKFILFIKRMPVNKPRVLILLYTWFILTYWFLLGCIKSLKYSVDRIHCLYISK